MDIQDGAFHLRELAPGVSIDEVRNATEGKLNIAGDIPTMKLD
jgi:3-oxoacid CoA-transferase subunit B